MHGTPTSPATTWVDPGDAVADIWLDADDRPYEVALATQYRTTVVSERIGSLTIEVGPLLVGDGSVLYGVSRNMFKPDASEFNAVAFPWTARCSICR